MTILDPLFKEISDGICVSDAQGNILYINPAAARMLDLNGGAPKETVCSLLCGHLATADSRECASKCPLREPGSPQKSVIHQGKHGPLVAFEWKDTGCNRVERWKNLRVRCLRMPTTLFDSWETEKHFTLIEDATAEMELERHKEDWRNMVAHDLRTPLTVIYAALKTLGEIPAGRPIEPREQNLLDISVRNCRKMTELLDLFLELARFEAGAVQAHVTNVALGQAVRNCVEEQSAFAQSRRIKVEVDAPETLTARADPELLARALQNLLHNALKFTSEGGRVTLSVAEESGRICLRVKDTGPGISPEHLPHIFDRFYQARARRDKMIEGNGLGLTFCRETLKAMGGEIDVESTVGQGSEFIVRLPRGVAAAEANPRQKT